MIKPLDVLKNFLIHSKDEKILIYVIEGIEYLKENFLDVKEFGNLDLEIEDSILPPFPTFNS